ncbi:hypothetical protein Poli38472_013556 [Pythium oligandrum]|uniref:EF-hand domain-containing protein n=1 Tax=Pythium oligandrum TaxID=41045 RepID=A0A8K1FFW6_PYTOL|nr:hypothetical protein Poli38472_013556 [Pythium oligandrum]|eukprot:TMW58082.1 hypothetical protein Poli38472_013556 [Pythium oligandrum]
MTQHARRRAASEHHGASNGARNTSPFVPPTRAPALVVVRLTHAQSDQVQEVVVGPSLSAQELAECLHAVAFGGLEEDIVAVRHPTRHVVYPLSLLARQPKRFTDAVYQVVTVEVEDAGESSGVEETQHGGVSTTLSPSAKAGTTPRRRNHHRRGRRNRQNAGHVGRPEFIDAYEMLAGLPSPSAIPDLRGVAAMTEEDFDDDERFQVSTVQQEDEDNDLDDYDDDDEQELLRELDLTDFELPQLVHVFTQACPRGDMDRATFEDCLEKILSQSGRYDPLARKMFMRLFAIFDADNEGVIDIAEFLGGVSVFASGERDEKIRFTFDLFDTDSDGFITLDEMTKYLTSVFIVISETSPELFTQKNVDPVELGAVTAHQCFREAAVNRDGKLSFVAFQQWYSQPGPTQLVAARAAATQRTRGSTEEITLESLREITGLSVLSSDDLFSIFSAGAADDMKTSKTTLTREQFKRCFYSILKKQKKKPTRELARFLDRLFNAFDTDGNDTVDFIELSSGLSILCGGSRHEKVVSAFSLFDADGDGYISRGEMEKYLASVFHVVYETTPSTKHALGIDANALARYTTAQAFAEADLNHDDRLSLEEFRKWYAGAGEPIFGNIAKGHQHAHSHSHIPIAPSALASIELVASTTSLSTRKADEVFELLAAKVNEDGVISRDGFQEVFEELTEQQLEQAQHQLSEIELSKLHSILNAVFDAFDTDKDGFVDFCELASGISVFCDGTQQEKIRAAFTLFDVNQDGFIAREEMETYLASVFRMVYTTSPTTAAQMGDVTPEELARVTTNEAFLSADVNHDGRLSFEEFTKWYTSQHFAPGRGPAPSVQVHHPGSVLSSSKNALKEMQELTNLGSYDINDIFEYFEASADKQGNVTKPAFFRCFQKLLAEKNGSMSSSMQSKARTLLAELFDLFDTDQNGVIDVQELGAGISILCGGDSVDKVKSMFTLYDLNRDGFISPEEMNTYLTAVFKVLYKASTQLPTQTGMTHQQLAAATTKACFDSCDHNHDNKLSFDEFKDWVELQKFQPGGTVPLRPSATVSPKNGTSSPAVPSSFVAAIPIDMAKKLTGLNNMSLEKVAQIFSSAANEEGLISRRGFDNCFYQYLCADMSSEMSADESARVHEVIDRVFTAFDKDGNGFVDYNDLSSGLSILCGGSRDAKVQAAFDLYDVNGDGLISEDEMVHYLTSVFSLLYALDPTRQLNLGISPDDLALITAAEIFADADTDNDGKLNFDEFKRWYAQPQQESFNAIVAPLDLNEVRKLTNLGSLDVVEVFERFAEYADEEGLLHRQAFDKCFGEIIEAASQPRTEVERLRAKVVADRLFDVFDRDHNGRIDFSELASGLSVLCKGARDAKVKAAFRLYDFNGDGFISLDEMIRYLTSIFKVLYEVQPQMKNETGVSAEELGAITAEQAFMEADLNHDGKLSYDEFLTWYNSPSQAGISSVVAKNAIVDSSLRWMPLNEIKQLTNLSKYEPEEVFEIFAAEASNQGLLSRSAFNAGFRKIIHGTGTDGSTKKDVNKLSLHERDRIKNAVNGLFDLFDADRSGYVDFGELASGLSVLCGGTKEQKVRAAFALFDFNGDGFISLEEMTRYLTSVFRVLFQVSPDTQHLGVTPEELGKITAEQAFAEADLDHDGRLTFEEFEAWYQQSGGIGEVAKDGEQLFSLEEARRLTNLGAISPMEVFEALAECADGQGYVSREAFDDCFRKFIASRRGRSIQAGEYERISVILNRLFDLFDVDKNGVVDFSEISSGLSVFCGGSSDEKVRAAFSLYDYNGDGYISLEEMTRYLTAVFKVLKEASPDAISHVNESAETLGLRTAEQAFAEADRDHDGRLSFTEFREWYTSSSTANIERLIENNIPEWLSLQEVRRLTNLGSFTPGEVFETFASFSSNEGTLSKEAFRRAFAELKKDSSDQGSADRLRLLVDRIFALFDADNNGVVDFSELASGLSVLCGGTESDKVRAAFNLYDVNHDSYISLGEMRLYLTSVFKVLFEVNPEVQSRVGVSPEELGAITAEQAFVEADQDGDGRLSYEEFRQWYLNPENELSQTRIPDWVSLQAVKEMTHLERYAPNEVFEVFANRCSEEGTISREAFEDCFEQLIDARFRGDEQHLTRLRLILDRLFTIFDADGNGVVDFCELSSGLSVLCGGSREDKVRSAFALYDLNQNGFISLEEMVRYLTSVFKVLFETSPETKTKLGVEPEELAAITAEQCFVEADLNHDGRLSFDEFVRWYSRSHDFEAPAAGVASLAAQRRHQQEQQQQQPQEHSKGPNGSNGNSMSSQRSGKDHSTTRDAASLDASSPTSRMFDISSENGEGVPASGLNMNSTKMEHARHLLKLDSYEVNDIFEIFAEAAPSGELTFANFKKCFDQIIRLAGGHETQEEKQEADQMIRRLFRVFDADKSNTVDFGELASGLSVLSGSSMDDKVRAAFQLYDINGDGFISLEEMTSYMTSIFKVMYETSDSAKQSMGVSPEELARVTANQCFKEADLNHDQRLSFEEFKKWCTSAM